MTDILYSYYGKLKFRLELDRIRFPHSYDFSSKSEKVKYLIVTDNKEAFEKSKQTYYSVVEKNRPQHVKFIDLREFDFSFADIKITKKTSYKSISRLSDLQKITKYIADAKEEIYDGKAFEKSVYDAFEAHFHNFDFFKFKEKRDEYVFSISLVKDKKVVERLNFNVGQLSMIYCHKEFVIQKVHESQEKRANRASAANPIYLVDGKEYLAEFNPKSYYLETVDEYRVLNEMIDI